MEHKCGLVLAYSLHDTYGMIKDLQHRGKEAAGIAAVGNTRIDVLKWVGRVDRFDREDLHKLFPGNDYHTFIAHIRYATRGRREREQILLDAHPHTIGGTAFDNGDHTLIMDCDAAMVHNGQIDVNDLEGIVARQLKSDCDTEALLHYYREVGERKLLRAVKGAYTLIIADKARKEVIVMRDSSGIRVGALGTKGEKYCVASEDTPIRRNGGKPQGDLRPGAIYYFNPHGTFSKEQVIPLEEVERNLSHCMFEYLYLASPESEINGVGVRRVRERLGEEMAKEYRPDIDFVTYVPRAPEAAARKYAEMLNVPFREVFYKPNADRSFMTSSQEDRDRSINSNFFLIPSAIPVIRGMRGIIVDDSIVRGTVSRRVRNLLIDEAGVKEATFFSYTPPIGIIGKDGVERGCTYGVDMPPNDKFIARMKRLVPRNATLEEISRKAGMSVNYLSREGLNAVFDDVGLSHLKLCMYCIGGEKPFGERFVELRKK